jgi:hypothetical protein
MSWLWEKGGPLASHPAGEPKPGIRMTRGLAMRLGAEPLNKYKLANAARHPHMYMTVTPTGFSAPDEPKELSWRCA